LEPYIATKLTFSPTIFAFIPTFLSIIPTFLSIIPTISALIPTFLSIIPTISQIRHNPSNIPKQMKAKKKASSTSDINHRST
jgi:hypothetical protein